MSRTPEDDIAFIRELALLLRETDLGEIEVAREYGEGDELKVRLTRSPPAPVMIAAPAQIAVAPPAQVAAAPRPAEVRLDVAVEDPASHPGAVTSPMVGTAYLSAEPGAAPYVKVGDPVREGQTLMIIEAMKTMNQIPSPRAGTVTRIFVDDKQPVEYGALLMIVE